MSNNFNWNSFNLATDFITCCNTWDYISHIDYLAIHPFKTHTLHCNILTDHANLKIVLKSVWYFPENKQQINCDVHLDDHIEDRFHFVFLKTIKSNKYVISLSEILLLNVKSHDKYDYYWQLKRKWPQRLADFPRNWPIVSNVLWAGMVAVNTNKPHTHTHYNVDIVLAAGLICTNSVRECTCFTECGTHTMTDNFGKWILFNTVLQCWGIRFKSR